jgi:hypothetical protein
VFWFLSARVVIPPLANGSFEGKRPFADALTKQANLNKWAAAAASAAAIFQAIAIGVKGR